MKYTEKNAGDPTGNTSETVCPDTGANHLPGRSPAWNLWLYSKYLTTRKKHADAMVMRMKALVFFLSPSCVERTASTAARLLNRSTSVLAPPSFQSSSCEHTDQASGYQSRNTRYATKSPEKKRSSCAKNSHMPSLAASNCWTGVSKW